MNQPSNFPSADSLLSSAPSAKFEEIGANVTGVLIEDPQSTQQTDYESQEPAFWKDGQPKMQVVLRLSDAAGEEVRVFVKGRMLTAVKKATRAAGTPLRAGGEISITYVGDGEAKRGLHAPKLYEAAYDAPLATTQQAPPQAPQGQMAPPQTQQGGQWPPATAQGTPGQPQQMPQQPPF